MLDTIYIGMSGLMGYSRGLRVIANDTANLNTPGFKGSSLQFADTFYANGGASGSGQNQIGYGLNTGSTTLNFQAGELRQTGNSLDLAVDGQGLFVLRTAGGQIVYTRDGEFQFNNDGILVSRTDGSTVLGIGADGKLQQIGLAGLRANSANATTTVSFNGNLSSTSTDQTVGGVKVIDASGGEHDLSVSFTDASATAAGSWTVKILDGTTEVGSGTIVFADGKPVAGSAKVSVSYQPAGQAAMPLVFDFSGDVTSFAAGDLSTLAMSTQDGFAAGALTSAGFDADGALALAYSNGQTVKGIKIAMARFDSTAAVASTGDNEFTALDASAWHVGAPGGAFGAVKSGQVEVSNVDLSQEFSDLVIMQRGYQASSQVVSTASDMLQELFAMKAK
jgi:flagellar hook protein FlgE